MTTRAPTRFPRIVRRDTEHAPSQRRYVGIAVFLAVITAIEVAVYYLGLPEAALIAILVILASMKFATVAAFFMHLRFDGRLLTYTFLTGLSIAIAAFSVAIVTIRAMS